MTEANIVMVIWWSLGVVLGVVLTMLYFSLMIACSKVNSILDQLKNQSENIDTMLTKIYIICECLIQQHNHIENEDTTESHSVIDAHNQLNDINNHHEGDM